MDKHEYSAAIKDMSAAIALVPDSPSLFYQRAMAYFALRDNEAARLVVGS